MSYEEIYVKNNVFKKKTDLEYNKEIIEEMNNSSLIKVKELPNGLKSYNFSREVFFGDKFNSLNVKARGLFFYENGEVACRAYDKFFNVYFEKTDNDEADYQDTYIDNIKNKIKFPVVVYKKENGYLGMLSWNKVSNDWLIATKSTTEGDYAQWFREILQKTNWLNDKVKKYIQDNNVTLIFECVDPFRDPHIITYYQEKVFLLDIVKNDLTSTFNNSATNLQLVLDWGFHANDYKELVAVFRDWEHLRNFLQSQDGTSLSNWESLEDYETQNFIFSHYINTQVEGFVVKDSNGYMFKFKTGFYRFWKSLRPAMQMLQNGKKPNENRLSKAQLEVYNWLKEQPIELIKTWSVIGMRNAYLKYIKNS